MTELMCAVCLYVRPQPGLDDDQVADTELLTIKSGILVCLRHIGCVTDVDLLLHYALKSAAKLESDGLHESLGAYQRWRDEQDQAQEVRP